MVPRTGILRPSISIIRVMMLSPTYMSYNILSIENLERSIAQYDF